jgi:fused signal recognition particle receptor
MWGGKGYNGAMNEGARGFFKSSLRRKINLVLGSRKSREEIFEELEELLVLADISMELVDELLRNVGKRVKLAFEKEDFFRVLKEELRGCFAGVADSRVQLPEGKNVIMLVGINGSGKTTTAAKLAHYFRARGQKVLLSAADTFRAAGSSQLSLWGERLGLPVIGGQRGADPGSVVYNSLNSLQTKDFDLLIVDTAGRVQTRESLMKELEKLTQVVRKFYPAQPAEVLLVIDCTMGQNTLDQARRFKEFSGITGIVLAKLDGTAKGGTILNILNALKIPVKFAGTGEAEGDLEEFSSDQFIDSLLAD